MGKSTHFIGQPLYSQVINLLDKAKILHISREQGGEHYTKRFSVWIHLIVMLYAVIKRFDSLREITTSLLADTNKLAHIGITFKIGRSTLADANKRRSESIFEAIYRDLYARYKGELISDSRSRKHPKWMDRLQIIDSTTITLFSNLIFKGVGRHPKTGKKKGGIKVHTVIHANEGVPSDIKFTSAATNDSFMLKPSNLNKGDIMAMDRAYVNYEKFEELTQRGVIYVTKMKKSLKYTINQVLLSAKNQKVSNNVSAVPINRYCGFIFQKVSPPFRQRALLLAVTIQILPVFSSSLSLGIQRRNMGLRSTSA